MASPFVITTRPKAWIDVEFDAPVTEDGRMGPVKIRTQVVLLPKQEADALLATGSEEELRQQYRDVITGWNDLDVRDADKQPVPFSPGALEQLLDVVAFRNAFNGAYTRALAGLGRRGN